MFAFPITLSCFQSRSAVPNSLNRQPGLPSIIARPSLTPSSIARPKLAQVIQRCHGLEVLNYLGGVNDVEILNISEQSAMPNFASFSHSWPPEVAQSLCVMMMIAKNGNKAPLQPLEDTQRGSKLVRIGLFPTPQTTTIDPAPPGSG